MSGITGCLQQSSKLHPTQVKPVIILILTLTFNLYPKASLINCPLLSILLIFSILIREYLALERTLMLQHTHANNILTHCYTQLSIHLPLFTSCPLCLTVMWLCCCSSSPSHPLDIFLPFLHFHYLSLSLAPLSLSLWQPLLNRAQQTVKTGERQCVVGVFMCASSCMSAAGGQYN